MTEQQTIVTDCEDREAPITASAWKNLIFLTDGRSVLGYHVYRSKEAAHAGSIAGEAELKRLMRIRADMPVVHRATREHLYFCREYSGIM